MTKPVALQLYSLRDAAAQDFFGVLKRVAGMGYAGVELAGLHGKPTNEVAQVLGELHLKVSSSHAPLPTTENIDQIAADAQTFGYKRLVCGFGPDDMKTEDACKALAEKLSSGCAVAKGAGLTLSIHNHWWEFDHDFAGKTPYDIMMEGAPALTSELDIYWCSKAGRDVPAVIKTYAKRIPLLHVKDGDLGPESMHKAVGDGKVQVKPIIKATTKKTEWLIVELDNCQTDMFDAVAKSLGWLVGSGLGHGRS